jgi:hypothetical protein
VRAWFACANQSPSGRNSAQPLSGRHSTIARSPPASAITMKHDMPSRSDSWKIRIPSSTVRARCSARRCGQLGRTSVTSGAVSK